MFGHTAIWLRGIAVALALVIGLSAAPRAFAAQDELAPPEGLTGGSSITYSDEDGSTTLILSAFSFEDENTASNGFQEIIDATTSSFDDLAAGTGDGGTPAAGSAVTELTDLEGLNDLGDEARAYEVPPSEGISFSVLFVRDGSNVHFWGYLTADFSSFDGSVATPAATPGAEAPVDILLGIATPWFADGPDQDAPLIDQLPGADVVPAGFTETDREESLDLSA